MRKKGICMLVETMEIRLYAPWVHSLKEKRMIVQSLITKIRGRFNVSIAEVEEQDVHTAAVLGMACVSSSSRVNESILEHILHFVEENTEAEVLRVHREVR